MILEVQDGAGMKKSSVLLLLLATSLFLFSSCYKLQEIYIESDLMPVAQFSQVDCRSIAILNFDASAINRKDVDSISLRDAVVYDVTKALYQLQDPERLMVIQGDAVQTVQETETIQSTKGDYEASAATIQRLVVYKYNPYQKVDAILSGRILNYIPNEDNLPYSYIELMIKLVNNIDGSIYWITKLRGNYKDVIYTIAHTLRNKNYTEPNIPSVNLPAVTTPEKK